MRQLTDVQVEEFVSGSTIFKQHVLPTEENLVRLADVPIVLLTRPTKDIITAYRRSDLMHSLDRPEWRGLQSEDEWLDRAEALGLIRELEQFHGIWREQPNVVAVDFEELTSQSSQTLNRVEVHLGLPNTRGPVDLDKMRWTGGTKSDYTTPEAMRFKNRLRSSAKSGVDRSLERLGLRISRIERPRSN